MRKMFGVFVVALGFAASASAGVITGGFWVPTPVPDIEVDKSEDDQCAAGPTKCAAVWFLPPGTEQLEGGFGYTDWPGAELWYQYTDYTDAPGLSYDGLNFNYDNGHGAIFSAWDGLHAKLYRQASATEINFWMFWEDLVNPEYFDRNDAMFRWSVSIPPLRCQVDCGTPPPCLTDCGPSIPVCLTNCTPPTNVPEPASMGLFGLALIGGARQWRKGQLASKSGR